jgi:glyoxylase-like metal-dependent hydrolase (beta-lactamase superfamily II)
VDNRTEQLADGVWRVEVAPFVNAFVLANDGTGDAEGLTIVDTGTPGGGPRLVRSVRMLSLDPRAIGDVLLTHWHTDHAGSAARFATSSAGARVWVGAADLAMVRGERPAAPPPPDTTAAGRLWHRLAPKPRPVPEARGLADGEVREVAGGLEVVPTPGHTAGHVAFLLPSRGVLLAGDALVNVGRLWRGPRFLCTALSAQRATAARLAGLDYGALAVAHGPAVTTGAQARVARLAQSG